MLPQRQRPDFSDEDEEDILGQVLFSQKGIECSHQGRTVDAVSIASTSRTAALPTSFPSVMEMEDWSPPLCISDLKWPALYDDGPSSGIYGFCATDTASLVANGDEYHAALGVRQRTAHDDEQVR